MSASPLDVPEAAPTELVTTEFPIQLFAPLSGGESAGDALTALPIPAVVLSEDPNDYSVRLDEYFELGDTPEEEITYSLISNTNEVLFDEVMIDQEEALLTLDIAGDENGQATLTLRATDGDGAFVDNTFQLTVNPHNDRPTTTGFSDVTVTVGEASTVVDLFAAFDDVEDADDSLTYEVVSISNPELFESVTIDTVAGTLTLDYADGVTGRSDILLRATDTEGLSVEMSSAGSDFPIYHFFESTDIPELEAMGIRRTTTLTQWAFFEYTPGQGYDMSRVDPAQLRRTLDNVFPVGFDQPVVFNIEHWGNNQEGRDLLAEVLDVAIAHRPDLEYGYYRLLPERNWWAPVGYQRGLNEIASGNTNGFYARNLYDGLNYHQQYLDWQARSELYRTEQVSASLGGGTIAERVDHVNPSLYAPYRTGDELWADPNVISWDYYAEHNIAEARRFDLPVNTFLSPSVLGTGQQYLEKDFFRHQLETAYELSDAITLFGVGGEDPFNYTAWFDALTEFVEYLQTPTGFSVTVQGENVPTATVPDPLVLPHGVFTGEFDLWATFHDPDHSDPELTYTIVDTVNGSNLTHLEIDDSTGRLLFEFSPHAAGHTEIIVRATDPDTWTGDVTFKVARPTLAASSSLTSFGFETQEDMALQLAAGSVPVVDTWLSGPSYADEFEITGQGAVTYRPVQDWFGWDTVRYQTSTGGSPETIELQFQVRPMNDAPIAVPDIVITPPLIFNSFDIRLELLFTDVDDYLDQLHFELLGFQGDVVQSIQLHPERQFARLHFHPDVVGTSRVAFRATDLAGAVAYNSIDIVRASGADPGAGSGNLGDYTPPAHALHDSTLPDDSADEPSAAAGMLPAETADQLFSAAGMLSQGPAEDANGEDDDDELVTVPLLSLQSAF